jgi:3-phenylpropionate/trans-cinnamate dioxygenase ferredoxin subunit
MNSTLTISKAELNEGQPKRVLVDGLPVCLAKVQGQIYAIGDTCTHSDAALSDGELNGFEIECWLHGAQFDIRTGQALTPPAIGAVAKFNVIDKGDTVEISAGDRDGE